MRYTILTYLGGIALVAYVQRAAISVPLQEIGRDLAITDATWWLGLMQSAWQLGYAVCQLPAGGIADRVGSRRAIVLLAVLWSLATALTACGRSYWEVVAAWTVMGVLQAGVFPCAVRTIGQVFADKERARASGWLGAGMLAGGAIAPVLTASLLEWLAPWAAAEGVQRWRVCLLLYAVPGLLWAAAYWYGTRSLGLDARRSAGGETTAADRGSPGGASASWRRACGDPSLLLLCGQQFLRAAASIFFVTWFPTFLRETRGVSLMQSGLLTSYAGTAAMLGVICGGYCSDWLLARTGNKRLARQGLAVVGMSTCAVLILLSLLVKDVNGAITLISLGAFVAAFGGVAGYTVAMDYGGDRAGTVFGAMNTAGNLGAMLFPVTVGWLVTATGTWNVALLLFAALMAVDAVLWSLLNPRGRFLEAEPSATPVPR